MRRRRSARSALLLALGLLIPLLTLAAFRFDATRPRAPAAWPAAFDLRLKEAFARPHAKPEAPYDAAFVYFVTGFHDRERPGGSRADEPGAPSRHGRDTDAFEAFARLAPMVAAWLASGRPATIRDLHGQPVDLRRLLHDGIVAGTTPGHPAYWGDMRPMDQRIVEAADVARTLWIVRDLGLFSKEELARAASWLHEVDGLAVPDNNWHLFPVVIEETLKALGEPYDQADIAANWKRFSSFERGDGWFSDGPGAEFDFYNAWAIQYELFWLDRIDPSFAGPPIAAARSAFLKTYPYLIGTDGIPIMGRSVCYRMAAPAPLVAAAVGSPDGPAIAPGLARHALDAVWDYFVAKGAAADGVPTQGYCGTDLRVLDNYSGPASCLWALRSLVLAFLAPPDAPFWTAPAEPLPIERGDYKVAIPAIGWTIEGDAATADVRIVQERLIGAGAAPPALAPYGPLRRLATRLLWRPFRPENRAAKYDAPVYSSAHPFCGCASGAALPQATREALK